MEIVINDPKNWLSKRQRQKIRARITEGQSDASVLENIEYRTGEGKYIAFKKTVDDDQKIMTLSFTDIDEREILRQKLRNRLNTVRGRRVGHPLESWRRYYELSNARELRSMVPDPPTMIKNKDQFAQIRAVDRSGWFTAYLDLCLADEDKLIQK